VIPQANGSASVNNTAIATHGYQVYTRCELISSLISRNARRYTPQSAVPTLLRRFHPQATRHPCSVPSSLVGIPSKLRFLRLQEDLYYKVARDAGTLAPIPQGRKTPGLECLCLNACLFQEN